MEQNKVSSHLKHDLITLGILVVVVASILGGLAYWEHQNGGFSRLAANTLDSLTR
jgi:hypothetical protein